MRRGAAKLHRSMRITTEEPIAPVGYSRFGRIAQGSVSFAASVRRIFWLRGGLAESSEPTPLLASERLQHDEKDDQNEDERRRLIDDPIKAWRSRLTAL